MPFVITLLRHGLGVAENQTRIGTGKEAWTLGAALAEGSKVGAGRGPKQRLLSRATTVSLCSGTFLLWTLFLAWTWWCTVRPTYSSMSPHFPWALDGLGELRATVYVQTFHMIGLKSIASFRACNDV